MSNHTQIKRTYSDAHFVWCGSIFTVLFKRGGFVWGYLRGDLSSFRPLFDFFEDELLDVDREPRSPFELEILDEVDLDLEPLLPLLLPDLPDDLVDGLFGDREFLCLWLSLFSESIELLLLLT